MAFWETSIFNFLLLAPHLLDDGEATYLGHVTELEETCGELPGVRALESSPDFLSHISTEEKAEIQTDAEAALLGMHTWQGVRDSRVSFFQSRVWFQTTNMKEHAMLYGKRKNK